MRPYQYEAHQRVVETWQETPDKGALLVMATGCGKTATGLHICVEEALSKGERVLWLAHREELVKQPYQALIKGWPKFGLRGAGIVQAGRDAPDAQIVFASMMTLAQPARMERYLAHGAPTLVVVDEAHHAPSPAYTAVLDQFVALGARRLGLTATPEREDGKDLGDSWEIAFSYAIVDAIAGGWLVEPYAAVHELPELDLSKVGGRRDYDDAELGDALLKAHVVEHTVEALSKIHTAERLPWRDDTRLIAPKGRSVIVFTATVEQARLTAEALCRAGWVARHISGDTPTADRDRLLKQFASGKIEVLCNCAILTEGTDLPRCDAIAFARPTKSWALYVQIIGRGLRLFDGKRDCLVIDLAGATKLHDLVSAPVLIGGSACPKSLDGRHVFEAVTGSEKARCSCCGARRSCWLAILAGGDGAHEWTESGRCRHCQKAQCEGSPTLMHDLIPHPGHMRACIHCEVTIRDPLASLLGKRGEESKDDTRFVRVGYPGRGNTFTDLSPETWAVDLGDHGFLLIVGDRKAGLWSPLWVPNRGRRPRPLTDGQVDARLAWAIGKDVVRKASRSFDRRLGKEVFGGQATEFDAERARGKARELVLRLGVAKRATG